MPALRRQQLDRMNCGTPGCDHTAHDGLTLHGRCHIDSPTYAKYQAKTGTLRITCARCGQLICEVAVAR